MATRSEIRAAVRFYSLKKRDIERLVELLRRAKIDAAERTLQALIDQLGLQMQVRLRSRLLVPLGLEARYHARRIARQFNEDLAVYAARHRLLSKKDLRRTLAAWADNRNRQRAPIIAVTEAYSAHADALLGGFLELGLEADAEFDFGGHPEDDPPDCAICKALVATSPHPLRRVVQIGVPHPNCRQLWHARDRDRLIAHLVDIGLTELGNRSGGIANRRTLIDRAGGRQQAAEAIRSGRLPR